MAFVTDELGEIKGEPICLAFANTISYRFTPKRRDTIETPEALGAWLNSAFAPPPAGEGQGGGLKLPMSKGLPNGVLAVSERLFARAVRLRESIYGLGKALSTGSAPSSADLQVLNAEVRDALLHTQLLPGERSLDWRLEAQRPSVEAAIWAIALSAAQLFSSPLSGRVRECASEGCGWLFLDLSKNQSRKWCSMRDCGNVEKARRYYSRRRERSQAPSQ